MQKDGFLMALAWTETKCKRPGAWYDDLMESTGFSKDGYYKVGHAALTLINPQGDCFYFDFGRYHAPYGYGRIRDAETDHDLILETKIKCDSGNPTNIQELYDELQNKEACHGDGFLSAGLIPVNFERSFAKAKELQSHDFIIYGPFAPNANNCSRFVRDVIQAGTKSIRHRLALRACYKLTPTPIWNVNVARKLNSKLSQPRINEAQEV